jgi:hypothetical protein
MGTTDQSEPAGDDSAHRLTRLGITRKRRVVHALLDFKPPNRNFRRIRNRFIDIGCHAMVAYYRLWVRWQDKAVLVRAKGSYRAHYGAKEPGGSDRNTSTSE